MKRARSFGMLSAVLVVPALVVWAAPSRSLPNPAPSDRIEIGAAIGPRIAMPGLSFGRWRYTQGGQRGEIWMARIDPREVDLAIVPARTGPVPLATLLPARPESTAVAINGGFYGGERPTGLVLVEGAVLSPLRRGGGSGVLVIGRERPAIVRREELGSAEGVRFALQSIDRLVADGRLLVSNREDLAHDARSFVAIDETAVVILAAVFDTRAVASADERTVCLNADSTTTGPTLFDVAELARRPAAEGGLAARWVLNLDGGWSTSMEVRTPSQQLSLAAHRATINAIVATPRR